MTTTPNFEPVIIGFTCNWCSYRAADLAGISRVKYPPNVRLIRLMCSGRLDPTFVLKALAGGADGVLITGCHPGECHYLEQNYKALRRVVLLKSMLTQFGIDPGRVKLVWASGRGHASGRRDYDHGGGGAGLGAVELAGCVGRGDPHAARCPRV